MKHAACSLGKRSWGAGEVRVMLRRKDALFIVEKLWTGRLCLVVRS